MMMRLLLLAFMICAGTSTGYAQVTLRYNRWLPPEHHVDKRVLLPWMAKVAEVTQGRVKIEPTVSSLGPVLKQYDLVSTGVADLVYTAEAYTPGLFPLADILTLPSLGTDPEKLSVAYWKVYEALFAKTKPYPLVHVLALNAYPDYHLFNSRREIASADDIRGLKFATTGEIRTAILKALGATVVSAGLTQLVEMTMSGVIDGTLLTDDAAHSFGLARVAKHRTTFPKGTGSGSGVFLINQAKWNAISEADRAAISKLSGEVLTQQLGASLKTADDLGRAENEKAGVRTIVADEKLIGALEKAAAPQVSAWLEKAKAKGVDGVEALNMLRALSK